MFGRKKKKQEADTTPEPLRHLHKDVIKGVMVELVPGEPVITAIEGLWKSAMIVTNSRVLVYKTGMMAGVMGGSKAISWELPSIIGVQMEMGKSTGFVAIQVQGAPIADMSYWGRDANQPQRASNAIAINKQLADQARTGVASIRQAIANSRTPPVGSPNPGGAAQAKYCANCGNGLAADARFCPSCGTPTS